jgi:hypothetical protein
MTRWNPCCAGCLSDVLRKGLQEAEVNRATKAFVCWSLLVGAPPLGAKLPNPVNVAVV